MENKTLLKNQQCGEDNKGNEKLFKKSGNRFEEQTNLETGNTKETNKHSVGKYKHVFEEKQFGN